MLSNKEKEIHLKCKHCDKTIIQCNTEDLDDFLELENKEKRYFICKLCNFKNIFHYEIIHKPSDRNDSINLKSVRPFFKS
jgi:hypothetical protein